MKIGLQEILIVILVITVLIVARRMISLNKKKGTTGKQTGSGSASSSKKSGSMVQTLRYAAIALAFCGVISLLAASQLPQYSVYLYIAGGLLVGGAIVFFALSVKSAK